MGVHNKSDLARNAKMDALTALYNGGSIQFYDDTAFALGATPATPAIAVGASVLLATNVCANPAFGAAVAGIATYNTDVPGIQVGLGNIGFCRVLNNIAQVVADLDVGLAASGATVIIDKVAVLAGEKVTIVSFTLTEPM